jgi:hypothetical protein
MEQCKWLHGREGCCKTVLRNGSSLPKVLTIGGGKGWEERKDF